MRLSLERLVLERYVHRQLDNFFPDGNPTEIEMRSFDRTLQRVEHCFSRIKFYCQSPGIEFEFNHLYSDQYLTFLWYLSNQVWVDSANKALASKIYYLNKALHSFDCLYDNALPSVFYVAHGVGITLGKAQYSDYLYVCKGVTVGASRGGKYPTINERVSLGADSTVIGDLVLESESSVGAGVCLFNVGVPFGHAVVRSRDGALAFKPQREPLSSYVFHY